MASLKRVFERSLAGMDCFSEGPKAGGMEWRFGTPSMDEKMPKHGVQQSSTVFHLVASISYMMM